MASRTRALALGAALLIGGVGAVQARVNSELADRIGDGITAAFVSFGSGLVLLAVLLGVLPAVRGGLARLPSELREHRLRWWQLLGGIAGALLVVGQAVTVPRLGVALFTVAVVGGQTSASLGVDAVGLGPAGRTPVTARRVVAAVVAVAAVLLSVSDRLGSTGFAVGSGVLALVAGALTSAQQAVNGRVGRATRHPIAATTVNFAVGTAVLAAMVAVRAGSGQLPTLHAPSQLWLYTGGAMGIVFIAVAARVVVTLGVLLLGLAIVGGQLAGALLLDLVVPTQGHGVTLATVAGVAVTLLAVLIAAGGARG